VENGNVQEKFSFYGSIMGREWEKALSTGGCFVEQVRFGCSMCCS